MLIEVTAGLVVSVAISAGLCVAVVGIYKLITQYNLNRWLVSERKEAINKLKSYASKKISELSDSKPDAYDLFIDYADWWSNVEDYCQHLNSLTKWQMLTLNLDKVDSKFGDHGQALTTIERRQYDVLLRPTGYIYCDETGMPQYPELTNLRPITAEQVQALERRRDGINRTWWMTSAEEEGLIEFISETQALYISKDKRKARCFDLDSWR